MKKCVAGRLSSDELLSTVMALLWVTVFPLWSGDTYASITRSRWMGMNVLAVASAVLLLVILFFRFRERRRHLSIPKPSKTQVTVWVLGGIYLLWVILSCFFGAWNAQLNEDDLPAVLYGAYRYDGLWTLLTFALVFFCLSLARPRFRPVLYGAALSLDLAAILAFVQYFDTNPLGLFPPGTGILSNYEFQSTFGNIDFIAMYLCLMLPLLVGAWLLEPRGGFFLGSALLGVEWLLCMDVQSSLVVMGAGIFVLLALSLRFARFRGRGLLTLSGVCAALFLRLLIRLPWLDGASGLSLGFTWQALLPLFLAALLLAAGLRFSRSPRGDLPRWILLACLLVFLLLCLLVFLLVPITEEAGSLWEIQQTLKGKGEDSFGSYRLAVWRYTWALAEQHPLFGLGPGTFFYGLQARLRSVGEVLPEAFDNPHNVALGVLAASGFPALLLAILFLGSLILSGFRKKGWSAIFSLALLAYLLEGLFVFSNCVVSPIFWAAVGLACGNLMTD